MQNSLENQDIKAIIQQCFADIYTVVRADMKKNFKTDAERGRTWRYARALVVLGDIAKNPDKYFDPKYTNVAWNKRTFEYMENNKKIKNDIAEYGLDYVASVVKGCKVEQPYTIVYHKTQSLFQDNEFWKFCNRVQDFYYADMYRTVVDKDFIKSYAQKISGWARVANESNILKQSVMKMFVGKYKRQYK